MKMDAIRFLLCASTLCLSASSLLLPSTADGEVTRLEIESRTPYAEGASFGEVGSYEELKGTVYFSVDPDAAVNAAVIDLELAPTDAAGRVVFSADFTIIAPADLSKANGSILYDVNNRGGMTAPRFFNGGNEGFLMRQGFVVVCSGWIGELLPGGARHRLNAPVAHEGGEPVKGVVRAEINPNSDTDTAGVSWANHGSYPPTERGLPEATLTVRLREKDARRPIARDQFDFQQDWSAYEGGIEGLPSIDLTLEGGFKAGHIYELVYEAHSPIVQGLGLAGIRDLVSYLKHDESGGNPLSGMGAPTALGFGISQSGRCLRLFVYDGFNADEQGRQVFEGLMPHVAGGGLGFFNHRFASPTRHNTQHDNHLYPADVFPFTYGNETDPYTKREDGILKNARAAGVVPKIMHTQSSAEYWHRSGSLVHTDPMGERDAVIPPEVRIYAIAGQHSSGGGRKGRPGRGQIAPNHNDYLPIMRALLHRLNEWVRDDVTPPESVYPRISDGTLVDWADGFGWRDIPGVTVPSVIQQPEWLDYGPEFASKRRIANHPPMSHGDYKVMVAAVDPGNNERGMLKTALVSVPVGSFTGWNLRNPDTGAPTELLSLSGGFVPFARNRRERTERRDTRPSVMEMHTSYGMYLDRYSLALDALMAAGYLLDEDWDGAYNFAVENPGELIAE